MKLSDATGVYIGSTPVSKLYVGMQEVWSSGSGYVETVAAFGESGYHASTRTIGSSQQAMSQTIFTVQQEQTHMRLFFDNAYYGSGSSPSITKNSPGWSATISASIVDNLGNFTRITFGGSNDAVIADGDAVVSDEVELTAPIAAGATHFVRIYYRSATGIIYSDKVTQSVGNRMEFGATVTDKTMSGTIAGSDGLSLPPFTLLGRASGSVRGALLIGDSICWGETGDDRRVDGDYGILSQSLTGAHPNVIMAMPGSQVQTFLSNRSNIADLDPYIDVVITNYGTNDLGGGGRTVQQVFDDLTAMRNLPAYAGKDFYICTMCPRTDTSNNPNTVTPKVVDFNTRLRSGEFDSVFTGWFDVAAPLESGTTPGTWADFSDTNDGLHPNQQGYDKVSAAGVITL